MPTPRRLLASLLLLHLAAAAFAADGALKTKNLLLVTLDGLRWQEVFRGPDEAFINKEFGGITDAASFAKLNEIYQPLTPLERRKRMMPFLWSEVATRGQLYGNRDRNSPMRVTNPIWISYPGYNEMLCGFPDPRIVNNAPIPNTNVTVLEWLNQRPDFAGRIVPLAAWNVFGAIFNVSRSHLPLWLTNQHSDPATASPRLLEIERWMDDIPTKSRDEHYDGFVHHAALDFIDTHHPRVLFVGFGEADTNGHRRAYDRYVDSIQRTDRFIRELWEKLQSLPQYRGSTTLIVTTDHGRGASPADWANHNTQSPGSDETWLAVLGPDTPALGERHDTAMVVTAQLAATVAKLLGTDYHAAEPRSAEPLAEIFPRGK